MGIKEDVSIERGIKDVIIEQQLFEISSVFDILKDKKNQEDNDNDDYFIKEIT